MKRIFSVVSAILLSCNAYTVSLVEDFSAEASIVLMSETDVSDAVPTSNGVLIHPQMVLTCAHSSPAINTKIAFMDAKGDEIEHGIIRKIITHPGAKVVGGFEGDDQPFIDPRFDLKILILQKPIEKIKPVQLSETHPLDLIGSTLRSITNSVVWQASHDDQEIAKIYEGPLKKAFETKATVYDQGHEWIGNFLEYTPENVIITYLRDSTHEGYLPFGGVGVGGDSGSPIFVKEEGVWKLVGIGSNLPVQMGVDGKYNSAFLYTPVSNNLDWIQMVSESKIDVKIEGDPCPIIVAPDATKVKPAHIILEAADQSESVLYGWYYGPLVYDFSFLEENNYQLQWKYSDEGQYASKLIIINNQLPNRCTMISKKEDKIVIEWPSKEKPLLFSVYNGEGKILTQYWIRNGLHSFSIMGLEQGNYKLTIAQSGHSPIAYEFER